MSINIYINNISMNIYKMDIVHLIFVCLILFVIYYSKNKFSIAILLMLGMVVLFFITGRTKDNNNKEYKPDVDF